MRRRGRRRGRENKNTVGVTILKCVCVFYACSSPDQNMVPQAHGRVKVSV